MALIEVKNLEKIYKSETAGTQALAGVSFTIEKGEFVVIVGPSGSGKSTLLHILNFLDRPTAGEYFFEGKSIHNYSGEEMALLRNQKMGFIFQAYNLLARTTAIENVRLPLFYSLIAGNQWNDLAKKVLDEVGLLGRATHKPSQLSGGEQQRVAIARALVLNPEVIFADEPTGNLDSKGGHQIMEILQRLNKEKGHTIVMITHESDMAEYAKRIIKLRDGKIEEDIKKQEPSTKYQ